MAWLTFKVPYIWIYMTVLRTHYFIDFTSGLCVGFMIYMWAEKLSYLTDVLIFGKPAEKRGLIFHKACSVCGWACYDGRKLIDEEEKLA